MKGTIKLDYVHIVQLYHSAACYYHISNFQRKMVYGHTPNYQPLLRYEHCHVSRQCAVLLIAHGGNNRIIKTARNVFFF